MILDTSIGPMPSEHLERKVIHTDTAMETTKRVEYWFQGVLVKSDAHIHLKQGLGIEGIFAK